MRLLDLHYIFPSNRSITWLRRTGTTTGTAFAIARSQSRLSYNLDSTVLRDSQKHGDPNIVPMAGNEMAHPDPKLLKNCSEGVAVANRRSKADQKPSTVPIITSLRRVDTPQDQEMMQFRRYSNSKGIFYMKAPVKVLVGDLIQKRIFITLNSREKGEIKLRPYFHSATKTLRFQRADGSDDGREKSIQSMAVSTDKTHLLDVAHAEGLLDAVPDGHLSSLRFDRIKQSGFSARTVFSSVRNRRLEPVWKRCTAIIRIGNGQNASRVTLGFSPAPSEASGRKDLVCFPYVGGDGLLHIWDVEKERDVQFLNSTTKAVMTRNFVRKRWPPLFELARRDGLWKED